MLRFINNITNSTNYTYDGPVGIESDANVHLFNVYTNLRGNLIFFNGTNRATTPFKIEGRGGKLEMYLLCRNITNQPYSFKFRLDVGIVSTSNTPTPTPTPNPTPTTNPSTNPTVNSTSNTTANNSTSSNTVPANFTNSST